MDSITHRLPVDVDVFNPGDGVAYERHFLTDVDALIDEILPQSPHVIPSEILVLEDEFYVFSAPTRFIDLLLESRNMHGRRTTGTNLGNRDFSIVPQAKGVRDRLWYRNLSTPL